MTRQLSDSGCWIASFSHSTTKPPYKDFLLWRGAGTAIPQGIHILGLSCEMWRLDRQGGPAVLMSQEGQPGQSARTILGDELQSSLSPAVALASGQMQHILLGELVRGQTKCGLQAVDQH